MNNKTFNNFAKKQPKRSFKSSFDRQKTKEIAKDKFVEKKSFHKNDDFDLFDESTINKKGFSAFQIRLVQKILTLTLTDGKPLDKAYALTFSKVKLPPTEQGFIIKQINYMFRFLSFYAYVSGLKRPSDLSRHVNRLIISYCSHKKYPVPNLDCEGFDRSGIDKRIKEANDDILLSSGCPIWFNELGQKELGSDFAKERDALSEEPSRYIRANTLKTTRENLAKVLSDEGVVTRPVKDVRNALLVTSNSALFRTKSFKDGFFEQQDAGSQLIGQFCDVKPSTKVVDCCAGSGGKTLHLAAMMEGKGSIIALDTQRWKLDELKKRARRAGAFNIETREINTTKVIKRLYESADTVLIDAPCSGTGVIRRTSDSKWRDIRAGLNELLNIQKDILERYSKIAKVGGTVVYSTCSILKSENQNQVQAFLEQNKDKFELIEEKQILPSSGFDGFYMAKFKRISK